MACLEKYSSKRNKQLHKECRYLVKDFGTSLSPKSTRLRDSLCCPGRPASVPLRHTIANSVQAPQHSHNGLTAFRMRLHMLSAGYGTCGPFATPTIRPRLRLPGTTCLRFALHGAQRRGKNTKVESYLLSTAVNLGLQPTLRTSKTTTDVIVSS